MLHEEILSAIIALMKSNKCKRIVFNPVNGNLPKVLRWLDKTDIFEYVNVRVLKFDGKGLSYKSTVMDGMLRTEKQWWSLRKNIAQTHIIGLYNAVWNYFSNGKEAA